MGPESHSVTTAGGIGFVPLGSMSPFGSVFDGGSPLYWEFSIDGETLSPRTEVAAVARAYALVGGGGGGVSSLNSLMGAVTLSAGSNVTVTPSGNTLIIGATGEGGGSLDDAYDNGGAGVGRTITADAGHVEIDGDGLFITGTTGSPPTVDTETRLVVNTANASFRVGQATGAQWFSANVGTHSSILGGLNNLASGSYTTIGGGESNSVSGLHSTI